MNFKTNQTKTKTSNEIKMKAKTESSQNERYIFKICKGSILYPSLDHTTAVGLMQSINTKSLSFCSRGYAKHGS